MNNWLDTLEEKIGDLEDIATESIQNEVQREKKMEKAESVNCRMLSSGLLHV